MSCEREKASNFMEAEINRSFIASKHREETRDSSLRTSASVPLNFDRARHDEKGVDPSAPLCCVRLRLCSCRARDSRFVFYTSSHPFLVNFQPHSEHQRAPCTTVQALRDGIDPSKRSGDTIVKKVRRMLISHSFNLQDEQLLN